MVQYVRQVQSRKKKLISLLLASDQAKERKATEREVQVRALWSAQVLGINYLHGCTGSSEILKLIGDIISRLRISGSRVS